MRHLKIRVLICGSALATGALFAATVQVGSPSVVLMAGQTREIPIFSSGPIAGDLTARGAFEPNDITFTPGPGCHLSADACTLLISAAPNSKSYRAVPVVVSESGATNTPVFALSVIYPGESEPVHIQVPKIASTTVMLSSEIGSTAMLTVTNTTDNTLNNLTAFHVPFGITSSICPTVAPGATCTLTLEVNDTAQTGYSVIAIKSDLGVLQDRILKVAASAVPPKRTPHVNRTQPPLQRSGNALFYGVVQPHPGLSATPKKTRNDFTDTTNGPAYQIVRLRNNGVTQPLSVEISGSDAHYFHLDNTTSDYGTNQNCASLTHIASGDSCLVIVKGKVSDPGQAPRTAMLTLKGSKNNVVTFKLTTTTYVYAAGGFNTLGNASVSGGDLLVQCTAGTCTNALQGTTGTNYATVSNSVGAWINALTVTPAGNLIVGGVFGAIGGATSGASSGTAALLAQCTPGSVTGDACINQIGTSAANRYAFNNGYIDGLTLSSSTNLIYIGGDFANIRNSSVTGGKMLARCGYSGTSPNTSCTNYLNSATPNRANNTLVAVEYLNSVVHVGGLFTQIAGYPSSAPGSGTTFASCTNSTCSQGMGSNNPNSSILGMTNDGISLYLGGAFTEIGGYTDTNIPGYPLVVCTLGATTTCSNALSGTNDANGYIEGLTYSGGSLYVGGQFTTIGGATPVSSGYMLAVCTVGGACSNFVTDTNPYASGTDWGGGIFAVAIGSQTSIMAN